MSLSFEAQCRDVTVARQDKLLDLPAQSAQQTLKRVDRAFKAFFRRVQAGQEPGYPRFKSHQRFKGWSYPTHGDGWRLLPRQDMRHGRLRLSGIGYVRIRGDARTTGEPKTCDIVYRHGKWYASIVLACEPQRSCGAATLAFDWGIETFATIASEGKESQTIANPRWLGRSEAALQAAYRARDSKHTLIKRAGVQVDAEGKEHYAFFEHDLFGIDAPQSRGTVGMGGRSLAWVLHWPAPPPLPSPVEGEGKDCQVTGLENCMALGGRDVLDRAGETVCSTSDRG